MLLVIVALLYPLSIRAQNGTTGRIDVFLADGNVYFVDALSGLSTVVPVSGGQNFTRVGNYVLYEKIQSGAIMRANTDGTLEPHPFIRRGIDTAAIRWVVSPDTQAVAWVTVSTAGESSVFVAGADGRDLRQLPISSPLSSPGAPLELAPLAITNGMTDFFYDAAHTPGTESTIYPRYNHVMRYSIADETFYPLPGEPNCPCSAAITPGGRIFARLEAAETAGGSGPFALHLWDLPSDAGYLIPAPDLPYSRAGDLILNESGTSAVYSAATGGQPGDALAETQYMLVLVDGVMGQQYPILPPDPVRYRPVAFIDGDTALLLIDMAGGATYKLDLASRELARVSDKAFLGTILVP
ncbi:MAG: hypothetical protein JXQ72_09455 [Anaerolineae bacterium]|nr:hypothetical protein [Anaerolineae bacterium]